MTHQGRFIRFHSVGIGETIVRALAAEGVAVAVHGRERERAERVADEINSAGDKAVFVLGDSTREHEVREMADNTGRLLGGVDILINNAGGSGEKQIWEETPAVDWAAAYDRNVLAAVRITDCLLPKMRAAQRVRVINVSSVAGLMPAATGPDYPACKAALNNLTVSLAKAVAKDGITVNTVSPGTIFAPQLEAAFRKMAATNGWADAKAAWTEVECVVLPHVVHVPPGKVSSAEDIAHAIALLCSPLAGYTTGINLRVDGGLLSTT